MAAPNASASAGPPRAAAVPPPHEQSSPPPSSPPLQIPAASPTPQSPTPPVEPPLPSPEPPQKSLLPPSPPPPMTSHTPHEPPQNSPPPPSKPEMSSHPPPEPPHNSPPPPSKPEMSSHPPPEPPHNSPPPPSKPEMSSHPPPEPPHNSPPPPSKPEMSSHPPPEPPHNSPPPPSKPETTSHTSPLAKPPKSSPPPQNSPPPPSKPATTSHPPPPSKPPKDLHSTPSDTITNNNSNSNSPQTTNTNKDLSAGSIVAIGVVLGLVLLTVLVATACCLKRRKKKNSALLHVLHPDSAFSRVHMSSPLIGFSSSTGSVYAPTDFDYEELFKATYGFSELNLLGEGGFGSVYKGILPDGIDIAVKKLKIGGGQGEREFKAEVEIISRIHHRHLVSLVGYCISGDQRLLVYEYIPNNSLHFHLHGEGRPVMDWAMRVKVAIGASRGIAYLHQDCNPRVIHRDIKSSNILLDSEFQARVCDFGLAKLALDANTHLTTRVMGTFGYLAPEYAFSGQLTDKSDVYSFGVVLLELITGRKSVDSSQPMEDISLIEWAKPLLRYALDNKQIEGLVDPRLEKNYVDSEMFLMIEAASACIRHSAKKRPQMRQIVTAFDSMAKLYLTNGMKLGHSEVYNSAENSAEIKLFRTIAFASQDSSSDTSSQISLNIY